MRILISTFFLLTGALLPAVAQQLPAGSTRQHQAVTGGPRPGSLRPDIPPKFPGGQSALQQFIREHLQYPDAAIDKQISGKLVVGFTVQADGTLTDVKIVSDTLGAGCEAEALRVVGLMPAWEPARIRTQPIAVPATLTLPFGATPELDDPKHRHQVH